jgi:hypothetical protein
MLPSILDPAYRASNQAGQQRQQQVLGIDMSLGTETAADIEEAQDLRACRTGLVVRHVIHAY